MAARFIVALVLVLFVATCYAGDYAKGVTRSVIPLQNRYYNHVPVARQSDLPRQFSWCDFNGRSLCTASWNQHIPQYCGSCWLHAALSMLQDRLKIAKNGNGPDVMLGRQSFLNCAAQHGEGHGCDGGDIINVLRYMSKHGLPDEACMPYTATDHTAFKGHKHCPAHALCTNCMGRDCWAVKTPVLYSVKRYGLVGNTTEDMMSEIHQRGPIACSIATPDDFVYNFSSGVYMDKGHAKDVDHDVEVVGWGEEDGTPYWLVRNSWGTYWNELGFFKLLRGANALHIESGDCWYAEPEYSMERDVVEGRLEGSMYGLHKAKHHPQQQQAAAADAAGAASSSSGSSVWKRKVVA